MESDIIVRTVVQDVFLFVWFNHKVLDLKSQVDISDFIPEISFELMHNLRISVLIETYRTRIVWTKFYQNHFRAMVSYPHRFANCVAYVCYVLNDCPDAYECFFDILSFVADVSLYIATKYKKLIINTTTDFFCAFFEKELRDKFESQGGWKGFNEYLKKHYNLIEYAYKASDIERPYYFYLYLGVYVDKGQRVDRFKDCGGGVFKFKKGIRPHFIVNEVVVRDITLAEVEAHENAFRFADSIWKKLQELWRKDFLEITDEFLRTCNELKERYQRRYPEPKPNIEETDKILPPPELSQLHEGQISDVMISGEKQYSSQHVQKDIGMKEGATEIATLQINKRTVDERTPKFKNSSEKVSKSVYTKTKVTILKKETATASTPAKTPNLDPNNEQEFPPLPVRSEPKSAEVEKNLNLLDNTSKCISESSDLIQPLHGKQKEPAADVKALEDKQHSEKEILTVQVSQAEPKSAKTEKDKLLGETSKSLELHTQSRIERQEKFSTEKNFKEKQSSFTQVQEPSGVMANVTEQPALQKDRKIYRSRQNYGEYHSRENPIVDKRTYYSRHPTAGTRTYYSKGHGDYSTHEEKAPEREIVTASDNSKTHNLEASNKQEVLPAQTVDLKSKSIKTEEAKYLLDSRPKTTSKSPKLMQPCKEKQVSNIKVCEEKQSPLPKVQKSFGAIACEGKQSSSKDVQKSSNVTVNLAEKSALQKDKETFSGSSRGRKQTSEKVDEEWNYVGAKYKKKVPKKESITASDPVQTHKTETLKKKDSSIIRTVDIKPKSTKVEKNENLMENVVKVVSKPSDLVKPIHKKEQVLEKEKQYSSQKDKMPSGVIANVTKQSDLKKDKEDFQGKKSESKAFSAEKVEEVPNISSTKKTVKENDKVKPSYSIKNQNLEVVNKQDLSSVHLEQKSIKVEKEENLIENTSKTTSKPPELLKACHKEQKETVSNVNVCAEKEPFSQNLLKSSGETANLMKQNVSQKDKETFRGKSNEIKKSSPKKAQDKWEHVRSKSKKRALQKGRVPASDPMQSRKAEAIDKDVFPTRTDNLEGKSAKVEKDKKLKESTGKATSKPSESVEPIHREEKHQVSEKEKQHSSQKDKTSSDMLANVANEFDLEKDREVSLGKKIESKETSLEKVKGVSKTISTKEKVMENDKHTPLDSIENQNLENFNKQDNSLVHIVHLKPKSTKEEEKMLLESTAKATSKPPELLESSHKEVKEQVSEKAKQYSLQKDKTSSNVTANVTEKSVLQKDRAAFHEKESKKSSMKVKEAAEIVSKEKVVESDKVKDSVPSKIQNLETNNKQVVSPVREVHPELKSTKEKGENLIDSTSKTISNTSDLIKPAHEQQRKVSAVKLHEEQQPSSQNIPKTSSEIACIEKQSSSQKVKKSARMIKNVTEQSTLQEDRDALPRKKKKLKESSSEEVLGVIKCKEEDSISLKTKTPGLLANAAEQSDLQKDQAFHGRETKSKESTSEKASDGIAGKRSISQTAQHSSGLIENVTEQSDLNKNQEAFDKKEDVTEQSDLKKRQQALDWKENKSKELFSEKVNEESEIISSTTKTKEPTEKIARSSDPIETYNPDIGKQDIPQAEALHPERKFTKEEKRKLLDGVSESLSRLEELSKQLCKKYGVQPPTSFKKDDNL